MTAQMHLVHGPQGAGKSAYARKLAADLPAVRFSIDEWMSNLFVPDMVPPLDMGWLDERVARCEAMIWEMAVAVLRNGSHVVLDLGFQRPQQRAEARRRAAVLGLAPLFHLPDGPRENRWAQVKRTSVFPGDDGPGAAATVADIDPPTAQEMGSIHAVLL